MRLAFVIMEWTWRHYFKNKVESKMVLWGLRLSKRSGAIASFFIFIYCTHRLYFDGAFLDRPISGNCQQHRNPLRAISSKGIQRRDICRRPGQRPTIKDTFWTKSASYITFMEWTHNNRKWIMTNVCRIWKIKWTRSTGGGGGGVRRVSCEMEKRTVIPRQMKRWMRNECNKSSFWDAARMEPKW